MGHDAESFRPRDARLLAAKTGRGVGEGRVAGAGLNLACVDRETFHVGDSRTWMPGLANGWVPLCIWVSITGLWKPGGRPRWPVGLSVRVIRRSMPSHGLAISGRSRSGHFARDDSPALCQARPGLGASVGGLAITARVLRPLLCADPVPRRQTDQTRKLH